MSNYGQLGSQGSSQGSPYNAANPNFDDPSNYANTPIGTVTQTGIDLGLYSPDQLGQQAYAPYQNTPQGQASALGKQEHGILNRAAPQMGEISNAGLAGARGNQLAGLNAQQELMAGPSLAGMRANQQFGGAQQSMMGAGARGGALGMRAAMGAGAGQLGAMSQAGGNAVGQEQLQGQQGIASGVNTLGQGDIASQQGLEQAMEKQRGLNLNQRGQNLGYAQGLEQNYFNTQNAYTQQAKAQYALYLQKQQGMDAATANDVAMGGKALGAVVGMG